MAKKEKLSLEELLEQALVKDEDKPYEVAENWVWTRFKFLADRLQYGYTESASNDKIGPQFLRITDIQDNNIDWINVPYCKIIDKDYDKYKVNNGDIVVARTGATTGKSYLVSNPPDAVFASYLIRISPISHIDPAYMWLFMNSSYYWNQIIENKKGSAQPGVNAQKLGEIIIPLPSLKEQQRIVALIESLFEKLDRAKELVQSALDSFEKRKSAILHKAFTGELTREWREENGVNFKKDWVKKALGKCGKWFGGGTPSKSNPQFWIDGNLLWVTPKDMKSVYIKDTEDKITEIAVDSSSAKLIPNAAVLFVVRSGILRRILPIAITTRPVTVNQDMKAIIPRDIDIKFFYWYCLGKESDIRNKCAKNGTTVESISSDLLYKYEILVPPLQEQQEIVRILDSLLENEQKAKELCAVIEKIDHMKKSILARAFRGELATNSPEEESALELLKEVLKEKTQ
ncbi:restriction endonuclease subunit S [Pelosinus sp. UFO1]|uniref:restriction endonuclease subunit S n=1 Tax=Pelosinus sp. UFO1 TaxID=484770 RepID=UPI0004D156B4|nr:restriction endonuclease subunit S [Pelosinus sp. UFO1]AIF49781.1 restriction modification system DNA specificity domain-containing protein [Pelosinus sp. UFO1]